MCSTGAEKCRSVCHELLGETGGHRVRCGIGRLQCHDPCFRSLFEAEISLCNCYLLLLDSGMRLVDKGSYLSGVVLSVL